MYDRKGLKKNGDLDGNVWLKRDTLVTLATEIPLTLGPH